MLNSHSPTNVGNRFSCQVMQLFLMFKNKVFFSWTSLQDLMRFQMKYVEGSVVVVVSVELWGKFGVDIVLDV